MHPAMLLILSFLLVSCTGGQDRSLSTQPPGLDVAQVALANGAPETALRIAKSKLAKEPRNVSAMVMAADAYAALGEREQAAMGYNEALARDPGNDAALVGSGRMKLASDPAAAEVLFRSVVSRQPHNVSALIDLGIAYDLVGRHLDAQRSYRRALAIEPDRIAANVNLGLSLALSGDAPQALRILRPIATNPATGPKVRQDLAVALALAGENEEAAAVLRTDMPPKQVSATLDSYNLLRVVQ